MALVAGIFGIAVSAVVDVAWVRYVAASIAATALLAMFYFQRRERAGDAFRAETVRLENQLGHAETWRELRRLADAKDDQVTLPLRTKLFAVELGDFGRERLANASFLERHHPHRQDLLQAHHADTLKIFEGEFAPEARALVSEWRKRGSESTLALAQLERYIAAAVDGDLDAMFSLSAVLRLVGTGILK
jgi:hypothetical protein